MSVALIIGVIESPTASPPSVWHAHEMAFGYGGAVVAEFLLTAIPNWTGRLPLQRRRLGALIVLWFCGRLAVLFSNAIGLKASAIIDLAFPFWPSSPARSPRDATGAIFRSSAHSRCYLSAMRSHMPMHSDLLSKSGIGNRLGVATLLMLVGLIGGRIIPSFTRNWLVKQNPNSRTPAQFDALDRIALLTTTVALLTWALAPEAAATAARQSARESSHSDCRAIGNPKLYGARVVSRGRWQRIL